MVDALISVLNGTMGSNVGKTVKALWEYIYIYIFTDTPQNENCSSGYIHKGCSMENLEGIHQFTIILSLSFVIKLKCMFPFYVVSIKLNLEIK